MKVDEIVLYNGKECKIKWIYDSDYCEIIHLDDSKIDKVELVHISEIEKKK